MNCLFIALQYDRLENQIKRAEADLFLWQILVDKVSGNYKRRNSLIIHL